MPMSYVCDMDGVIYHGSRLIPGAIEFVQRLQSPGHKFLFLTNNCQWTPRDLKHKLEQMGISVDETAFHPACGALVAPIELATEKNPHFVGKPNPLMMWTALATLQSGPAKAYMVGDRMDTDIIAGTEAGMRTILVLSCVTTRELIETYPHRPSHVFEDVGHIPVAELG